MDRARPCHICTGTGLTPATPAGYIAYMGAIQLLIGSPFLAHEPLSYLSRSFQLNRVFM